MPTPTPQERLDNVRTGLNPALDPAPQSIASLIPALALRTGQVQSGGMRTSIDLDPELERDLAHAQSLTREKQATIIRLALRAGLPVVLNRFQTPRPEGYFADAYANRDPERTRLEAAHAQALEQEPER
jgi:hypothetical protein